MVVVETVVGVVRSVVVDVDCLVVFIVCDD